MAALLAAGREDFAALVVASPVLEQIDHMYSEPVDAVREDGVQRNDTMMAGFYISHNTGIGLRCFAWGIVFGLGSLERAPLRTGSSWGRVFGHMATTPHAVNFYTFVTAHSSFELTAIVLSGAAGLRLGWGLVDTQGQSRISSLRREAANSLPAVGAAVVLFVLAALVEGYVSASSLPYSVKAAVAILSAAVIIAYLTLGGRGEDAAGRSWSASWPSTKADSRPREPYVRTAAMDPSRPFCYRPGCSAPGCDRPADLQDRGDLERRHEPGAEELWPGVRRPPRVAAHRRPASSSRAQALRRRVGRPGRALRLAPGCRDIELITLE